MWYLGYLCHCTSVHTYVIPLRYVYVIYTCDLTLDDKSIQMVEASCTATDYTPPQLS